MGIIICIIVTIISNVWRNFMKKMLLALACAAVAIPVIGMEKEEPEDRPGAEISSYIDEFMSNHNNPNPFGKAMFMLDLTNSLMTITEMEEWFNADDRTKLTKELEAWVRFRIACDNSSEFGDNYNAAKNAFREYLRNDPQAISELPKPKFSIKVAAATAAPTVTTPRSWGSWAWQQATPQNIAFLAAGVGASYWLYKNFNTKDIRDGLDQLMKKFQRKK
jgi:hypothetical protein